MKKVLSLIVVGMLSFGGSKGTGSLSTHYAGMRGLEVKAGQFEAQALSLETSAAQLAVLVSEAEAEKQQVVQSMDNSQAVQTVTETVPAYTCKVGGCKLAAEHTHEICPQSNCTETGSHEHGDGWYYGHNEQDGHGHNVNHKSGHGGKKHHQ